MVTRMPTDLDRTPDGFKPTPLSDNAKVVMERRITARNDQGESIETPDECFRRVAKNLAEAEIRFGGTEADRAAAERIFYETLASLDFLPNSPTLVNAGRDLQQLSACFVLPVEDSIEGIFEAVKHTAMIHKSGGGTGFAFSRLRPANDRVQSTMGVASGPVSFMKVFDAATEAIKQGGTRRGANMGILRVDHPDIDQFIEMKADMTTLQNFNISVAVTDRFMEALQKGEGYDLVNPKNGAVVATRDAREVWEKLIANAWKNGDPGVIFIDRINAGRANPVPSRGPIESTNPCVTGDTLVYTATGLRRAADLAAEASPIELVVEGAAGRALSSPMFRTGRKPVFRLVTDEGYEVRLTADHRVRTRRGWVAAQDLAQGDRILLLSGGGGFGQAGSLALGRLLGWLVGDGTFAGDRAVLSFFGAEQQELAPRFAGMMAQVVAESAGSPGALAISVGEVAGRDEARIRSARFMRIAAEHGLVPGDKHHVPEGVFAGSEDMQRGFLQALFTADGHVAGSQAKGVSVRLTSISKGFLVDVQRLLLNFGIASRIYEDRRPGGPRQLPDGRGGLASYETKPYHDLVIARANLATFAASVGFLSEATQSALVSRLAAYRRRLNRETFVATFRELVPDGDEDVYDLTEPLTHSFVANGLVVHNCGEQPLYPYDSCNLGSLNLAHFTAGEPGKRTVDYERLAFAIRRAVHLLDNVIEMNAYPIPQIAETSHAIRRIGLGVMGWADMLIDLRIPYDSDEALALAREVMAFIQREADAASEQLAGIRGSFPDWAQSRYGPGGPEGPRPMRNSTRTTIAPTGTLSIIADCSGGIEPVFALAFIRSHYLDKDDPSRRTELFEVNHQFEEAAKAGGWYSDELIRFLAEGGHLGDRPEVPEWVRRVFVTAHDIAPEWHVRMQAAFQEFTDNAVSKTINFPNRATIDDVRKAYELAYATGCNGITIYRDGSRELQVLKHAEKAKSEAEAAVEAAQALVLEHAGPVRRRLPDERASITHKFRVGEQEGYMTVGMFDDGTPGEVFINVSKQGSTVSGLMDTVAMLTSYALQYGVPISELASKLKNTRFEPSGPTNNRDIPIATSIVDYVFRWLELKFGGATAGVQWALIPPEQVVASTRSDAPVASLPKAHETHVPSGVGCPDCGAVLFYGEGCLLCRNCGYNKCG
jgi:ribonucleoside-diphosphate reductase alpha chain